MLFGDAVDLGEKFFDLVVFEADHLSESIELDGKDFLLVLLVVFEVLDVEVDHFLELVFHFFELLVFLSHVVIIRLFLLR